MNIIAYAWNENASSQVRAYQPLLELQSRRGHLINVHTTPKSLTPTDSELAEIAATFDVAYIARYTEPEAQQLTRRLQAAGVPVVWDHDDDQLSSRRDHDDAESRQVVSGIRAMLGLADVVTTTNDRLADRYLEEGANDVIVIPNYLSAAWLTLPPRSYEGLVLGYIGWADHKRDWVGLGLEATVRDLLDAHPDLRVESVGPLDLELPPDRYSRTGCTLEELIPYTEVPPYLASFDIGVAPLRDTAFNRSRSDIKLKEYAVAGVPWLASPVGPYAEHGEEQGGRLVDDGRWYEELDRLIRDGRGRRKLAKKGQKWARHHTIAHNISAWEDAFLEAIDVADERRAA